MSVNPSLLELTQVNVRSTRQMGERHPHSTAFPPLMVDIVHISDDINLSLSGPNSPVSVNSSIYIYEFLNIVFTFFYNFPFHR